MNIYQKLGIGRCLHTLNLYNNNIFIIIIILYDHKIWSLTLREEVRLREFENRILRRIFWLEKDDNSEWRRLHNEY